MVNRSHVDLTTNDAETGQPALRIDGNRVQGVTRVVVDVAANDLAHIEIHLAVWDIKVDGQMHWTVPDTTRAALELLGWEAPVPAWVGR